MSENMLRLIAHDESLPVETDAPEAASVIPYDVGLQADLEEFGPDALEQFGRITVRNILREDRWNSCLWYAAKWGLTHDRVGDDMVLRDPMRDDAA